MALAADAHTLDPGAYAPRFTASVERLRGALLWLTGFAGAFVFVEPSPYEVASLLTMIVFAITGLVLAAGDHAAGHAAHPLQRRLLDRGRAGDRRAQDPAMDFRILVHVDHGDVLRRNPVQPTPNSG